jgi:curved DNA-binding protein CbpA
MKTVYDVLGVAPNADDREIRTAFRNSAKVMARLDRLGRPER